jgi:hypothetical protein
MDDVTNTRWEGSGADSEAAQKPVIVTKLRISKDDGTAFVEADLREALMVVVNKEDEILGSPTIGKFSAAGVARELELATPLMFVEGMRLEIVAGAAMCRVLHAERQVRDVTQAEALAWFEANLRTKAYPARWYGAAEADVMRAKIDSLVLQARDEGLRPHFVSLTDPGQLYDASCRACDSEDPEDGPFNAQLLTKRDDDHKVLYFAFPIVCGVCSENEEMIAELIAEIWDRGRGLSS